MTAGRGPDVCIEAVGLEAHDGNPLVHAYDRVKQATRQQTERGAAMREAILAAGPAWARALPPSPGPAAGLTRAAAPPRS